MAYINEWDEAKPDGSEQANTIDTIIQDVKKAVRERMAELMHSSTDWDDDAEQPKRIKYAAISDPPTIPTARTDAEINALITIATDALLDSAPLALDTLNEIAAALDDDANFATSVATSIATKLTSAQATALIATWARANSPSGEIPEGSVPESIARVTELPSADTLGRIPSADPEASKVWKTDTLSVPGWRDDVEGTGGGNGNGAVATTTDSQRVESIEFTAVEATSTLERQQTTIATAPVAVVYGENAAEIITAAVDANTFIIEKAGVYLMEWRGVVTPAADRPEPCLEVQANSDSAELGRTDAVYIRFSADGAYDVRLVGILVIPNDDMVCKALVSNCRDDNSFTVATGHKLRIIRGALGAAGVPGNDGAGTTETRVGELIQDAVDALLAGAPTALDTLNELADAIGDDADYAASVTTALAAKINSTQATALIATWARVNSPSGTAPISRVAGNRTINQL